MCCFCFRFAGRREVNYDLVLALVGPCADLKTERFAHVISNKASNSSSVIFKTKSVCLVVVRTQYTNSNTVQPSLTGSGVFGREHLV